MRKLITIAVLLVSVGLYAQESVSASGGNATGAGGSSSYTVGQTVYSSHTTNNGSVDQGVQQPFELSTTVGVEETEINLELVAFPNPTTNSLTLETGDFNNEKLTYQLYDLQGKLVESKQVTYSSTSIRTQDLPASTYLLSVLEDEVIIKTFRIVKN